MVKKTISLILSIFLVCIIFATPVAAYKPSTFTLTAEGCLIANVDTDSVIYEKNGDTKLYPASLTKIMTAVVVLDECADPKTQLLPVIRILLTFCSVPIPRYLTLWAANSFRL